MFEFKQVISKFIWENKYKYKTDQTVQDTFMRIAKTIASTEKDKERWTKKFFDEMDQGFFIPGGRITEAGTEMPYYANCYTIAIEDSIEGIGKTQTEDLLIATAGGGTGMDVSPVRPKGTPLTRGGGAAGPVNFLRGFNAYAKMIETSGHRRAAHIALLDISHPDIEEFITCKQGDRNRELTQFNLSVKVTDEFIEAVKRGKNWDLKFGAKVYKTVKARELYDLLTKNAYINNEPGIFNVDTVNKYSNLLPLGIKINACNPCGELILPDYSLCCLGSMNLPSLVKEPFTEKAEFDFEVFKRSIGISVRFLDDVLDKTAYPLEKIKENSLKYRRIGLGFTGLGSTFAMLGMVYGESKSKELSKKIVECLRDSSYEASIDLAVEKGKFPGYDKKILESKFIAKLPKYVRDRVEKHGLRNIGLNTCAPTGTTSIAFGHNCSSGIEPILALEYNRTIRTGRGDETITEKVEDYAHYLFKKLNLGKEIPNYFKVVSDIDPYDQIDVQAIFQEYIDHSISKTANLPKGFAFDDYKRLFMHAYEKGLKGFTTYNPEGSMKGILEVGKDRPLMITRSEAPARPKELSCDIHKASVSGEEFIILVGLLNGMVYEIFAGRWKGKEEIAEFKKGVIRKVGKGIYELVLSRGDVEIVIKNLAESFTVKNYNTFARLLSMGLRHGTPLEFVVEQLHKDENFVGFERAVARVISKYVRDGETIKSSKMCGDCGGRVFQYESGCQKCASCGWTACE